MIQANELLSDYEMGIIEHSGKMLILMDILSQSVALREKILVFRYSTVLSALAYLPLSIIQHILMCHNYLQITNVVHVIHHS